MQIMSFDFHLTVWIMMLHMHMHARSAKAVTLVVWPYNAMLIRPFVLTQVSRCQCAYNHVIHTPGRIPIAAEHHTMQGKRCDDLPDLPDLAVLPGPISSYAAAR